MNIIRPQKFDRIRIWILFRAPLLIKFEHEYLDYANNSEYEYFRIWLQKPPKRKKISKHFFFLTSDHQFINRTRLSPVYWAPLFNNLAKYTKTSILNVERQQTFLCYVGDSSTLAHAGQLLLPLESAWGQLASLVIYGAGVMIPSTAHPGAEMYRTVS